MYLMMATFSYLPHQQTEVWRWYVPQYCSPCVDSPRTKPVVCSQRCYAVPIDTQHSVSGKGASNKKL